VKTATWKMILTSLQVRIGLSKVIVENLKIKQPVAGQDRCDPQSRKPSISTNTSGIPVTSIAEGCSADFRPAPFWDAFL